MNRRLLIIAAVLGIAVCCILIAIPVVRALTLQSRMFVGERSIDLGTKAIHGEPAVLTNQFTLRNSRSEAVHILGLRPSCGCVQAQLPHSVVHAGAELVIPFTMTLERAGTKEVFIEVVLPEGVIERLYVKGTATQTYAIMLSPSEVNVSSEPKNVQAFVEVFDGANPPPQPVITAPQGVQITFAGWTELDPRHIAGVNSRRYRGDIDVAIAPGTDAGAIDFSDATLSFQLGELDRATARLRPSADETQ